MKRPDFLWILLLSATNFLFAQEKLITNAYNRESTSLNGYWKYIVDPYENGFIIIAMNPLTNKKIL